MFGLEKAMASVGKVIRSWIGKFAKILNNLTGGKITPNFVTMTGLIAHIPIAWLIATGQFGYSALGLVIFGLFDTLDGELARLQNKTSLKGMLLDASTDRVKEVLLYSGAVYFFANSERPYFATWAVLALGGSLCVSYIKAKGETALLDVRKIPTISDSPDASKSPFSALRVSSDTLPSEKRTFESPLDDSENGEVSRKSSLTDKHLSAQEKNRVFSDGLFRFELRMFALAVGLVFGWLEAAVVIIAIGAFLTAFARLIKISKRLSP